MSMEESGVGIGDALQLASRDGEGWGGSGSFLVILLFCLLIGTGGGWGGRGGQAVTESDLCTANNFTQLEGSVGRISDSQAAIARQTDNAICNLGYETLQNFNATQSQGAAQAAAIQAQIAAGVCSINETTVAQSQKVLDAIAQGKIDALEAKVSQLELQNAMSNVMRYPQGTTYTAGYNPFFNQAACGGATF